MESNSTFAQTITDAFKCVGISGKASALSLLTQYFETTERSDSIAVLTSVMESLSGYYQNLHIMIDEVPTDREFYAKVFAPNTVKFCNSLMTARENHLDFKSSAQQKLFVSVMLDVIYQEFKFAKIEKRAGSMITKLVDTFDFVMFRSEIFTEDTIMTGIKTLLLRMGYDTSEVFFILKYIIILEIEKSKAYCCKVTEMSENWKMLHDKLLAKVKERGGHVEKYKFFSFVEWVTNTCQVALQTYDFFTHRHQLYHLSKEYCNKCHQIPKLPPIESSPMNFSNWDYEHIRLDFFMDIQALAKDIIDRVKEAELIDESLEGLITLFTTLLQLSIDSPEETALTYDQKLFMLVVIFLPFQPMMNTRPTNLTKEFKDIRKILSPNLLLYTDKKSDNQLTKLKLKMIASIPYLQLSKCGQIGNWLGTTVTRLIFTKEKNLQVAEKFTGKFKDLLISNSDFINPYLQIYKDNVSTCIELKWILCLQDKNVVVIKRLTPPNFSKEQSYDIFCKSCNQPDPQTKNSELLLARMKESKGTIFSIDEINVTEKLSIDYEHILITPQSHKHFVRSIKTCIVHNGNFPQIIEVDDGVSLMNIILKRDEDILFHTEQCLDSIIKSIVNSQFSRKESFFSLLFKTVAMHINEALKNSLSMQIQKSYAGMMATIACNAELIPLENKEIIFKKEVLVVNSLLATTALIVGNGTPLRGALVELTTKMLRENGMEFSQALQWYQVLIEGVSNGCLIECIRSDMDFLNVLRNVSIYFNIKKYYI